MVQMRGRALAAATALMLLAGNAVPGGAQSSFSEIRAAWAEARSAARSDAATALPKYDALVEMAKGNGGILLSAIAVAAKARDRPRLARWLQQFVALGGGLGADDRAEIAALLGADAGPLLIKAGDNAASVGEGALVAALPGELPLIEGVARNPHDGAIFVSSVTDRRIERFDRAGRRRTLLRLSEAEGFPMGLAFDSRRGTLWAAVDSAAFATDKPGSGGLMRISPSGEHILIGADTGTGLHIGDIALSPDGSVYAADSRSGAVYRCARDCTRLSLLVAPGHLRSAQGMVPASDGKRLYIADYAYGLLAVDTRSGAMVRIGTAPEIALDGIDGLARRGKRLIAIQNGWTPARVVEIELDPGGTTATSLRVLARGAPAAEQPGQFVLEGRGEILMIANSQWARLDRAEPGRPPAQTTRLVRLIEAEAGRR